MKIFDRLVSFCAQMTEGGLSVIVTVKRIFKLLLFHAREAGFEYDAERVVSLNGLKLSFLVATSHRQSSQV